jgi:hypothetical protein
MATKKPKGWKDNPLGEINKLYNAVMPGGRDVTQPQSLAQFKDVTRAAAAGTVKAVDMYTTGGLGLSFAQNVIMPANSFASKETRTASASKGMTQFAKDAAITAASAGAGVVAGKAVQVGAAKVVESGLTARLSNIVKGETVLVHGSPVKGLTEIRPSFARATPNERRVYGMRTDVPLDAQSTTQMVTEGYATGGSWVDKGKEIPSGGGSLYVIKTPKKTTDLPAYPKRPSGPKFTESGRPIIQFPPSVATSSSSSGRVVGEVPLAGKNTEAIRKALQQELKKAGAKVKPNVAEKMLSKVEQQKLLKRQRIADKNSPV